MRVILRRPVSNALELAAAYAHDRHPDFIMKLRITFHLQRALRRPIVDVPSPSLGLSSDPLPRSIEPSVQRRQRMIAQCKSMPRRWANDPPVPPVPHARVDFRIRLDLLLTGASGAAGSTLPHIRSHTQRQIHRINPNPCRSSPRLCRELIGVD